MRRFFLFIFTFVLVMNMGTICYAAELSTNSDATVELEVFDLFSSDINIPALPASYENLPYRAMCYEVDAFSNRTYFMVLTSDKAIMKKAIPVGSSTNGLIYSFDFKNMDSVVLKWAENTDSWMIDDDWVIHGSIWPFESRDSVSSVESLQMMYSNYNIENDVDDSIYYFKTPAIKSLSYQWAISNFVQIICRVALLLLPIIFTLLVLFIVIRQVKKMIHLYVKGVSLNG